ncbi:Zinc finger protein [Plakobranchus ocellatus]|uniref:Zinc finger protein n=1 Tax=Plakobranchus ocellatus TaxID=259542 RepID=A0AAV3ZND3_9GAST|nr:Zinc finger protein [Plakobranchus ocellatus]
MLKLVSGKSVPVMANCCFERSGEDGEVKALCIPDAICDVIVGNVEGARSPENPDMSVMVGAATTRAQAKREAVTKLLRVPDIKKHVGVDREQLIKLQQEDPRILALVDAGRTSRRGGKVVSFEKARGIVYRRYEDLGRSVDGKQVVLPKPLRQYVMSVAHDSITGAHLGIRRTKDKVLSNFYWPGIDGDVTRYCRSCNVCQRIVKKGSVSRVPLEKVPLIDTPFKRVAIDLIAREELEKAQGWQKRYYDRTAKRKKFSVGEKVLVLLPTDSNKLLMQWKGPFEIVTTVGINDYRINMGGKEKTFHANLLKGYIARDQDTSQATTEERPPTSSLAIPAASVTVIEDLGGEHFNDNDCEALPELGGWGSEETVNDLKYGDELTLDQRRQLEEVAVTYSSIFSNHPGTASTEEHCIELTSSIPVLQHPYPVPYAMRQTLRDELREMEDLGVIRKSSSPYASPVVVVKKKDGTNRVCIDYRRLNKLTIFDPQPMTPPADIFQGMEKDQYFLKIDLSKGYWQIPVRKEDIPKTAFVMMDCFCF